MRPRSTESGLCAPAREPRRPAVAPASPRRREQATTLQRPPQPGLPSRRRCLVWLQVGDGPARARRAQRRPIVSAHRFCRVVQPAGHSHAGEVARCSAASSGSERWLQSARRAERRTVKISSTRTRGRQALLGMGGARSTRRRSASTRASDPAHPRPRHVHGHVCSPSSWLGGMVIGLPPTAGARRIFARARIQRARPLVAACNCLPIQLPRTSHGSARSRPERIMIARRYLGLT